MTSISTQDTQALDRIKLRNLLDQAQAKLARATGLVQSLNEDYLASRRWREEMSNHVNKESWARVLLAQTEVTIGGQLLDSHSALRLVCERDSVIRRRGDQVAHGSIDPANYTDAVGRYPVLSDRAGLLVLIEYICTTAN